MDQAAADPELGYPGCPCVSGVVQGPPALDDCCDWRCDSGQSHGQLSVHIEDVFPTDRFPTRSEAIHPCAPSLWVVQTVITVARCVPTMDESGRPPSAEAAATSARILSIDLYSIVTAMACCVPSDPPPGRIKRRTHISYVNTLSEGGCGAFVVGAFVDAGGVCGCPEEVS